MWFVCLLAFLLFRVDYTNLTGYGAWAGVVTEVEGEAPLGGTFQLSFRSNGPTPPIPYDATAEEMKAALHVSCCGYESLNR